MYDYNHKTQSCIKSICRIIFILFKPQQNILQNIQHFLKYYK